MAPHWTTAMMALLPLTNGFAVGPRTALPSQRRSGARPTLRATEGRVDWEVTRAEDGDVEILAALLKRKREFDRDLSGEEFSKAMQPRQGETLNTLYPGFPQCRTLFIGNSEQEDFVGYATYGTKHEGFGPPYLWLEDIFVDPAYRSGGAGRTLMEHLAEEASKLSCTHLWWIVDQGNQRGIDFYQKLGAEIDCRDAYQNMSRMRWEPASLNQ